MNVLVVCEFSGKVRDSFIKRGVNAVSVDLLPSESEGPHYVGDIREFLELRDAQTFDMLVGFPPCTYLASSGARWWSDPERQELQRRAIEFVEWLWNLPIPLICIENPVGCLSTRSSLGKPTQIIQPWQFGHGEVKTTCLWLKGLPALTPTNIVEGRYQRIWKMSASIKDRQKRRSITYDGIAAAMAEQWAGRLIKNQA